MLSEFARHILEGYELRCVYETNSYTIELTVDPQKEGPYEVHERLKKELDRPDLQLVEVRPIKKKED